MRNKKVVHFQLALLLVFISFGLTPQAFAETTTAGECLPGWNAKMERLRAAQRAHSCSGSANMTECRSLMGLGAVGIAAAAKAQGAFGSRRAALAVRDAEFRACPLPGKSNVQLPNILPGLNLFVSTAWASCTPRIEIERSQISNAISEVADEVESALNEAKSSLKAMEKLETELAGMDEKTRIAKSKEVLEASIRGHQAEFAKTQKSYEQARDRMRYQEHADTQYFAKREKDRLYREFKDMFRATFGRPFDEKLDYNINYRSDRNLAPHQQEKFKALFKEIEAESLKEFNARMKIDEIERDPQVKRLRAQAESLNSQTNRVRSMSYNAIEYSKSLSEQTADLRLSLAELEKSKEALQDFQAATKAAKSSGDLFAIADRLHRFVPKDFLADPAKRALSGAMAGLKETLATLVHIEGRMTDASLDLIRKWTAHLPEAGAGLRKTASLAAKGIAFVGGSFVSLATFASNEFAGGCPGTPSSTNFPADPDKGCSRDYSFNNPAAAKLAAMASKDLCELAKSNPNAGMEIDQMIATNYDRYYPGVRGQCGSPLKLSSSRWGNLTFDGKETLFTPIGETKPVSISYDERGNETSVRLPKYIRSGGTEKVDWGGSAPFGYGDRFEKASAVYRDMVRPILAEATACCSGSGVTPSASDCARWGLTGGSTGSGSQPLRGGPTGR